MNEVRKISKLLIDDYPIQVLPKLAKEIGLNEAIILQQIHYWVNNSKHKKNGRYWIYNSYKEWESQFPFWSNVTIRRTISSLEKQKLLITGNFNKAHFDKTKWYTIDYKVLQSMSKSIAQNEQTNDSKRANGDVQNEQTNTIDYTEITSETTNNIDQSSSKEADKVDLKNRFDLIWKEYPKKQGKENAFKSYQKAVKDGTTDETILNGINAYKKQIELQRTEIQFIKQGSTFFNQRSYLDEFVITNNRNQYQVNQTEEIPPEWAANIAEARKIPSYDDSELPELPY